MNFMQDVFPSLRSMMTGMGGGGGEQAPMQIPPAYDPFTGQAVQAPMPMPQQKEQGGGMDLKGMMTMLQSLMGGG